MDSKRLVFGQDKVFKNFCPRCGLALFDDGGCPKYHKIKNEKRRKFSGRSKTPYGGYEIK